MNTVPVPDIDAPVVGYIVNAGLDTATTQAIGSLQGTLSERISGLWVPPPEALHITILDLLTPVTNYAADTDTLFNGRRKEYLTALEDILRNQAPIDITFDTVEAFPAAIIVKGSDDGSLQHIRDAFMREVQLEPGTKLPPNIIHSTIAKFTTKTAMSDVYAAVQTLDINQKCHVSAFRLVRETKKFMLSASVVASFALKEG